MSISRHVDDYLEERGLREVAEVVPENSCQVFDGDVALPEQRLAQARQKLAELFDDAEPIDPAGE